ncbi:MAG: helix-turn-helix transcriptional regulator [Cytophagaceae bacterium]|jgi:DNA-binding CsgD family transcriptional regulator|nr:helix-turn-helix transcriptional regulator [Cytophagaceae bacterium]
MFALIFKQLHDYIPKAVGEQNIIDKQRRAVFVYSCVGLLVIDIFLIAGRIGPPDSFFYNIINVSHLCVISALLLLCLSGKLSIVRGISALCVANQIELCVDIWQSAVENTPYAINLIMGNMVLSGLNMLLILMAYIRVLPFVLAGLTMIAYGGCCWMSREAAIVNMFPVFLVCFTVIALLGHYLSNSVYRLEHEKIVLKEDEQKVLNMFELDKYQLMAYISLAKEKGLSAEQTGTMLDLIGKKAHENIRNNVSYYYRQQEIDYANLRVRLPQLTHSEIEICDLILKEKKMKEILQILGKSEGNVTSQRTNIRRKLGLSPSENLRDALVEITKK